MTVKELIDFLSKQNPQASLTLTKSTLRESEDEDGEAWYDDEVTDLLDWCISVDLHSNVDFRWL